MQQFNLVYFGHFNWRDTERMPTPERRWFHEKLKETVNEQNQEIEEANQKISGLKK